MAPPHLKELTVQRPVQVQPLTVLPIIPSSHACMSNRWRSSFAKPDWPQPGWSTTRRLTPACSPAGSLFMGQQRVQTMRAFLFARTNVATLLLRRLSKRLSQVSASVRPALDCCQGTSPSQVANCRPLSKCFASPIEAARDFAMIGPIPGISSNLRLVLFC